MKKYAASLLIIGSLIMSGCGDDKASVDESTDKGAISIGGTSSFADPLPNGTVVNIQLVAADGTEDQEGAFSFKDKLIKDENYTIIVSSAPTGWDCTVTNGSDKASGVNIANVIVNCN
jgi:hypothetical protein